MAGGLDYHDIQISAYVNALRAAMTAGDTQLYDELDQKVLLALVTRSAADMAFWVKSRTPDGSRRAAEIADLAAELKKRDVVGNGLAAMGKYLTGQVKQAAGVAAGVASAPAWWASATGLLLGFIGLVVQVGNDIGAVIAFVVFVFVSIHIVPPVRMAIYRMLGGAFRSMGNAARSAGSSAVLFWKYPATVGVDADRLFRQHVTASGDALRGAGFTARESRKFIQLLQGIATVVVVIATAALIAGVVVFAVGFNHGFLQQAQTCEQQAPGTACGIPQ